MKTYELVVPCHFGLEAVLKREIYDLGYEIGRVEDGRITFTGDEEAICRANIFLRTAERVLIQVGRFHAETFEELFQGIKALPWEDGSEQTIRDHAGWRFAAAAVLAALLIAGGVLRVLLPVGPVYRGELTVAQFAENYNRIQRQLGDAGIELDENGRWKEESSFQSNGGTTTVMFNDRLPQLEYQTENGVLTGIVYHAEGGEADSWISIPSGSVMQYALFAFAGAEKGHILLDKPLQTAASELCDSVFSEYHTVVDGVAVDYVYTDTIIDSTRTQYSYTLTLRRVQG